MGLIGSPVHFSHLPLFGAWLPIAIVTFLLTTQEASAQEEQLLAAHYEQYQEEQPDPLADTVFVNEPLFFLSGMDKIANTLLFKLDAGGRKELPFGTLLLRQEFRSRVIRGAFETAFRDDEELDIKFSIPLSTHTSLFTQNAFRYSSDSRSIGINTIRSGNLTVGLESSLGRNIRGDIRIGPDYNEQLGLGAGGLLTAGRLRVQPFSLDEYAIGGRYEGLHSALADGRTLYRHSPRLFIDGSFGEGGSLSLDASYLAARRDFYTLFSVGIAGDLPEPLTETRQEELLSVGLSLRYPIINSWSLEAEGRFERLTISRSFKDPAEGIDFTLIRRMLDENRLSFRLFSSFRSQYATIFSGISVEARDEANGVFEQFAIPTATLERLRIEENQRDNISSRLRLFTEAAIPLFHSDSLLVNLSATSFRYDTPSPLNNDDRDEIWFSGDISYLKAISPALTWRVGVEGQARQLVFLRAARSAQNNTTYILRLFSAAEWQLRSWRAVPRFEVLVNYTVFDYENSVPGVRSFSFRQVGYRDTISLRLSPQVSLQTRLFSRYFERGELLWTEFAEVPQDQNLEMFHYLMMRYAIGSVSTAAGIRYYSLSRTGVRSSFGNFNQFNVGPAVEIELFLHNTYFSVNGWYEFQFTDKTQTGTMPNIFLTARRQL